MIELLAPAGDMEKLKTAVHFGANAVYMAGKKFGLRAFAENFTEDELKQAVEYAHERGVKVYVTVNVYAKEEDFDSLPEYLCYVKSIGADAVLVSDPGIVDLIRELVPGLSVHLSTQANTTNSFALRFWAKQGVKRIVLARECTLKEATEMTSAGKLCGVETEAFVHGAMCVSYSGRCLLSDFLTGRGGNRGECVQACRWNWKLTEPEDPERSIYLSEDERGSYLLNSKDLRMIEHIPELIGTGIASMKIEGRNKSAYYVGTIVNAYRRAIDRYYFEGEKYTTDPELTEETVRAGHRSYTTGFYFGEKNKQYYESSRAAMTYEFIAVVLSWENGFALVEMRNRFGKGDLLNILGAGRSFNKTFVVQSIKDQDGNEIDDVYIVQQKVSINCPERVFAGDILRREIKKKGEKAV